MPQLAPLVSEPLLTSVTPFGRPVSLGARAEIVATTSPVELLASLILGGLDEDALEILARRLQPHLRRWGQMERAGGHVAYTVSSLAAELGVSQKAIRCAIARRELSAVKRGSRWIISAEAVHAWTTAPETERRASRTCSVGAPKAAGPSLRSVFCGQPRNGSAR